MDLSGSPVFQEPQDVPVVLGSLFPVPVPCPESLIVSLPDRVVDTGYG